MPEFALGRRLSISLVQIERTSEWRDLPPESTHRVRIKDAIKGRSPLAHRAWLQTYTDDRWDTEHDLQDTVAFQTMGDCDHEPRCDLALRDFPEPG